MCVSRPGMSTTRRSRRGTTNITQNEESADNWNKMANSNFRSTVFENRVHVWVLPLNYSQSKYGGRKTPSSACTIITVQIAHDFLSNNVCIPPTHLLTPQHLPLGVLDVLINGIVDGNETHEKAMAARRRGFSGSLKKKHLEETVESGSVFQFLKKPHRDTFTVPEAIQVQRPEMHEIDYRCYSGDFISNLVTAMSMAVNSPYLSKLDRLAIGVLAFERAMCFIYDRPTNSIILLDTHMHFKGQAGSVLCVASFEDITDFIVSVTKLVFHEVFKTADVTGQFEITCLMLTSLTNKVHKGGIFLPIKSSMPRVTSSIPLKPIRIRAKKMVCVGSAEMGSDSGYESDTS
ncbi:ACT domain-containing protein [Caenorhabditis elegans]|uniref:ACT domain-containing protein n=1 Tax=Caenorhabditis elegans TaxID=6239 RepID=Q23078_CAEEL|nr:ACT domain-containing protein [Caenorhabditis elegans]CCD69054.1 ACT domain-containing protein [Caenorhabditis elegans]|eukprot:NP_504445.2 Uncharacterized protein CELE_ZC317.6 [Caenorhabditis elegans]